MILHLVWSNSSARLEKLIGYIIISTLRRLRLIPFFSVISKPLSKFHPLGGKVPYPARFHPRCVCSFFHASYQNWHHIILVISRWLQIRNKLPRNPSSGILNMQSCFELLTDKCCTHHIAGAQHCIHIFLTEVLWFAIKKWDNIMFKKKLWGSIELGLEAVLHWYDEDWNNK